MIKNLYQIILLINNKFNYFKQNYKKINKIILKIYKIHQNHIQIINNVYHKIIKLKKHNKFVIHITNSTVKNSYAKTNGLKVCLQYFYKIIIK